MNKQIFANRFGLIALTCLSLFASATAFAGSPATAQQVVVTNSPAQPVPMVGLVKDSDAPARKPFQTHIIYFQTALGTNFHSVTTVPANQRLVIEHASGVCWSVNTIALSSGQPGTPGGYEFLPAANTLISIPVKFYANPGDDFGFTTSAGGSGYCNLTLSGYYVNLP
jgi:hypothetical protein